MEVEAIESESESPGWTEDADLIVEVADVESDTLMDISEDVFDRMSF